MGYSLVAISMMILYCLALIYREIFSKALPPSLSSSCSHLSPCLAPASRVLLGFSRRRAAG